MRLYSPYGLLGDRAKQLLPWDKCEKTSKMHPCVHRGQTGHLLYIVESRRYKVKV
jgi:hypothetical protein